MKMRRLGALLVLSIATAPVTAAANDALIGGIVGGIVGTALSNAGKRKTTTQTRTYSKPRPSISSAQREQNRTMQSALNYFGFDAGVVDGIPGGQTRRAVASFQSHMNYAPTGKLSDYEQNFLISSYRRAQAGGPATSQFIAANPLGVKGLLIAYRDEQTNGRSGTSAIGGHYGLPTIVAAAVNEIAKSSDPSAEQLVQRSGFIQLADLNKDGQTDYILDTSVTGSAFWCNAQSCAVRVFASTPDGYERTDMQAFNVTPAMLTCQRGNCFLNGAPVQPQVASQAPAVPQQPQTPQTQMVVAQQPTIQTAAPIATPVATAQPVVSNPNAAGAAQPAVPNFFAGNTGSAPSLASHCNQVALLTSTNGGFVTADSVTDPGFALSEQFCLARTYAITRGEEMVAKLNGVSPAQVEAQCKGFSSVLKEYAAAISLKPRTDVLRDVGGFVLGTGMSTTQLAATARICLSVGYRVDDMDVAIGSALILAALGESPYDELIGHHLSQGIAATKRYDLASEWYGSAVSSLQNGAQAAFAPGQSERVDLIRKASLQLSGASAPEVGQPKVQNASVPTFGLVSD